MCVDITMHTLNPNNIRAKILGMDCHFRSNKLVEPVMACVKLIHTSNLTQNFWIYKILHNVDVHIAGIFNYLLLAAAHFFMLSIYCWEHLYFIYIFLINLSFLNT